MIETAETDRLLAVTMDRPERRNALTPAALAAIEEHVTGTEAPVVYLHGAGGAFSAGADLEVVRALGEAGGRGDAEAFVRRGQRTATAIEEADSVVVAGIEGPARGGGVELALACDVRVATPDATLGEPGVSLGLFGAWGGTVRLPRVVGLGDALEFALSGRTVDAAEARRMGLVSRVVDDPRAVAEELAASDPLALEVIKARVRDDAATDVQERREAAAFARLVERSVEERQEG